jgi:hypothetical protein
MTWAGGGCVVTEENLPVARTLLASVAKPQPEKPQRMRSSGKVAAAT